MKAFTSWSSGKESCLSLFKVSKDVEISYIFNMISEDNKHSRSHGVDRDLIKLQAECLGIPLLQRSSSWDSYEQVFKQALGELKKKGIKIGVFGDIDVQAHRDWVERVCTESGIIPILPLWQREREELVSEFIDTGFKAIVVSINNKFLGKEWLGRNIDEKFIADLKKRGNVDVAGEAGEYHTFVYNGPCFKKPVEFETSGIVEKDGYSFLEIFRKK